MKPVNSGDEIHSKKKKVVMESIYGGEGELQRKKVKKYLPWKHVEFI